MTDNIVSLTGSIILNRAPQPSVVRVLEEALERARSGEVVGVALIQLHHDGLSDYWLAGMLGGHSILGASVRVQAALTRISDGD